VDVIIAQMGSPPLDLVLLSPAMRHYGIFVYF